MAAGNDVSIADVRVEIGKGMQSNTTVSLKVYLMAILDNYMFRPLLAIFRFKMF